MRRRPPPRPEPRAVGGAIERVLSDLGHGGAAQALRISECWAEAVGEEAARHAEPAALRERVLEVAADSSVWAQHLQLRHDEILAALREHLGEEAPASLRVRIGSVEGPATRNR